MTDVYVRPAGVELRYFESRALEDEHIAQARGFSSHAAFAEYRASVGKPIEQRFSAAPVKRKPREITDLAAEYERLMSYGYENGFV
jgi:hypothetical protein